MRTQVLSDCPVGSPWLEMLSAADGPPEKLAIPKFPFILGRSETADLQIDSSAVSREHAVVEYDGREYRVRDLGSTNGTLLNGQRITETVINDGDVIQVANIEITFFSNRRQQQQSAVTQVLAPEPKDMDSVPASHLIYRVRGLREALMLGCQRIVLQPIVELDHQQLVGYEEVSGEDEAMPTVLGGIVPADSRLAARRHEFRRIKAAEATVRLNRGSRLFVRVAAADLGGERLVEGLVRLADLVAAGWQVVVQMPYEAACGAQLGPIVARFRACGIGLACDGFADRQGPWLRHPDLKPDYLKLAASLVHGLPRTAEHRRMIQSVVESAEENDCTIIAAGVRKRDEADLCRELGCRLGQGPLFGHPQPLEG